jgi:hypothetical protein
MTHYFEISIAQGKIIPGSSYKYCNIPNRIVLTEENPPFDNIFNIWVRKLFQVPFLRFDLHIEAEVLFGPSTPALIIQYVVLRIETFPYT